MDIVMNMSGYKIIRDLMEIEYGEEVMCAGWIPAVALMSQLQPLELTNKPTTVPTYLATVNPDLFMQRMYTHQS
jgi:hypothetical protein